MAKGLSGVRARLSIRCWRITTAGLVAGALLGVAPSAWPQDEPPDTTAVGAGKVLDLTPKVIGLTPKVLDIVGISRGVAGTLVDLGAKVTETEIKIALSGDILFDFDKDTLRPDAFPTLQKVAEIIAGYPGAPVLIEGYTDSKGKDSYNLKLSDRRAASVKKWLVEKAGADAGHIKTKGWGEAKPVAPNENPDGSDDPDGRQKNRRVEITIKTK
jgi:outer membrane protein OmpA-like peptidoglycan-associated protein